MRAAEKIVAFLHGVAPGAFCDDCITIGLNLPRRQGVAIVTLTLSLSADSKEDRVSARRRNTMAHKKSWLYERCRAG